MRTKRVPPLLMPLSGDGGGTPNFQLPNPNKLPNPKSQQNKPYDIRERTMEFALRVLEICGKLPENPEGYAVRGQLVRCGTSIGANVEEADGAVSRADKRKSFVVARKECRETRYWLKLIERKWAQLQVGRDISEATEILYSTVQS